MYLERRPGMALGLYIDKLWCSEGYAAPHARERVLPNGRVEIVIDLASASELMIVHGMRASHSIVETANMQGVVGAVFRPGGTRALFDSPANEFRERDVSLEDVWGVAVVRRMRESLLQAGGPADRLSIFEAHLTARLQPSRELHSAVGYALSEFVSDPCASAIAEVARDAGLSRRRLAALFQEQVGLPPKLYCRLQRFRQVVRRIAAGAPVDWAQISVDGGYYDQAHMAHEFREFAGVSPGSWQASARPFLNHAVVD